MNPEIAALWIAGASLVLQAVSMIPRNLKDRTKEDEDALHAVSDAYYATQEFYSLPDKEQLDPARKWNLARKWEHAGILLQKYDSTLANRLNAKSEFWRSGGTWSDDAIEAAGIGLERIKREVEDRMIMK